MRSEAHHQSIIIIIKKKKRIINQSSSSSKKRTSINYRKPRESRTKRTTDRLKIWDLTNESSFLFFEVACEPHFQTSQTFHTNHRVTYGHIFPTFSSVAVLPQWYFTIHHLTIFGCELKLHTTIISRHVRIFIQLHLCTSDDAVTKIKGRFY